MENRIALIGIIVENYEAAQQINEVLHRYGSYIIGRMGVPYEKRKIQIISVAVDAPQNIVSALSGQLGKISGVTTKTMYSKN